ncbi:hypothetical protein [Butyrivibrio sp. YAB3001]|uniref:hypothetical protein n=1 Tax=Butyrivibrio sp. YAB3001 TaxID=1520812 RepID=UPI0008F67578|nr:hypothetical protein [Butyrivibrio sp. YAB3001]SFC66542.1 hypothetical protein SAMN02910398_02832 [Butyrivibrio sp. YAB3001]
MREFVIENGIVIDDMDSVIDGIREISGKTISDAETIRKFITREKATKYYIDKKCSGKMQPDKDTIYLWLDSGFVDKYGNSIMISLLNDSGGGYSGHYFGTMDVLARAIKSYFPKNAKDISRNLNTLKSKYQNKIADRNHRHIEDEQEYLVMICNDDSRNSEIESLISGLNIQFEEPIVETEEIVVETPADEKVAPGLDMSFREKEITVGLLLDTIDDMQEYINELLEELKKSDEDKVKLRELEDRNKVLEQALVDIRSYNAQHYQEEDKPKKNTDGHDLLGRRGKILVLGATAIDVKTMNGIAKLYGFRKDDFEYEVDYEKMVSFAGRSSKLSSYSALILGACPHKVQNLGDWSSLVEKCKNTEGMPIAIDARSRAGELKVTKESFREALVEICKELNIRDNCNGI